MYLITLLNVILFGLVAFSIADVRMILPTRIIGTETDNPRYLNTNLALQCDAMRHSQLKSNFMRFSDPDFSSISYMNMNMPYGGVYQGLEAHDEFFRRFHEAVDFSHVVDLVKVDYSKGECTFLSTGDMHFKQSNKTITDVDHYLVARVRSNVVTHVKIFDGSKAKEVGATYRTFAQEAALQLARVINEYGMNSTEFQAKVTPETTITFGHQSPQGDRVNMTFTGIDAAEKLLEIGVQRRSASLSQAVVIRNPYLYFPFKTGVKMNTFTALPSTNRIALMHEINRLARLTRITGRDTTIACAPGGRCNINTVVYPSTSDEGEASHTHEIGVNTGVNDKRESFPLHNLTKYIEERPPISLPYSSRICSVDYADATTVAGVCAHKSVYLSANEEKFYTSLRERRNEDIHVLANEIGIDEESMYYTLQYTTAPTTYTSYNMKFNEKGQLLDLIVSPTKPPLTLHDQRAKADFNMLSVSLLTGTQLHGEVAKLRNLMISDTYDKDYTHSQVRPVYQNQEDTGFVLVQIAGANRDRQESISRMKKIAEARIKRAGSKYVQLLGEDLQNDAYLVKEVEAERREKVESTNKMDLNMLTSILHKIEEKKRLDTETVITQGTRVELGQYYYDGRLLTQIMQQQSRVQANQCRAHGFSYMNIPLHLSIEVEKGYVLCHRHLKAPFYDTSATHDIAGNRCNLEYNYNTLPCLRRRVAAAAAAGKMPAVVSGKEREAALDRLNLQTIAKDQVARGGPSIGYIDAACPTLEDIRKSTAGVGITMPKTERTAFLFNNTDLTQSQKTPELLDTQSLACLRQAIWDKSARITDIYALTQAYRQPLLHYHEASIYRNLNEEEQLAFARLVLLYRLQFRLEVHNEEKHLQNRDPLSVIFSDKISVNTIREILPEDWAWIKNYVYTSNSRENILPVQNRTLNIIRGLNDASILI